MDDEFAVLHDQVEIIREVFVYAQRFYGKVFVFQLGSHILGHPSFPALIQDLAIMHQNGIRIILVPGGGVRIEELLSQYNIESPKVEGTRISTEDAMPLIEMAAFDVANRLMTQLASVQVDAVIGTWVKARAMGVLNGIDYKDTGVVAKIRHDLIERVIEDNFVPILPCIGWSSTGKPYNVSSHELASKIAIAMKAQKLFFITAREPFSEGGFSFPQDGIVVHEGYLTRLTAKAAEALISQETYHIEGFERQQIKLAAESCRGGVDRVHFLDGTVPGVVLKEVYTTLGYGVMVHGDPFESIRRMESVDIPDALRVMEPFIQEGILVRRTEESLQERLADYIVFEADQTVHGVGALHLYGAEQAEIAGIAVDEKYSHLGIGEKIVRFLIEEAKRLKLKRVFLLTTQTADWFVALGFKSIEPEALPADRLAKYDTARKSRVYALDIG